jgi:hypothetical protein
MSNEPADAEIQLAAETLSRLQPGFLPFSIFHEITRLTTTPIIEVVPLRRNGDVVEILLLKRDANDPVWPNQFHTPGTVLRATDSLKTALERISNNELIGVSISEPKFVTNVLHHSGRGMEFSQIYWVNVEGDTSIGQFFDTSQPPDTLVKSQLDFIPQAIEDYKARF